MAKFSTTIQHDWMRFIVKFADGVAIKCLFNRGGSSVDVTPTNASTTKLTNQISTILLENKQKSVGDSDWNMAKFFDVVEVVAKDAATADDFVEGIKAKLGFKAEIARPADAPERAIVTTKQSRGQIINAHFPSGERVELKVNKSSLSIAMKPDLAGPRDAMTKFIFGVKGAQMVDDETLNRVLVETAQDASDMNDWLQRARDGVSSSLAPKP